MIVLVTGSLKVDDGEHPMNYTQTFHLIPEGGTYYVSVHYYTTEAHR